MLRIKKISIALLFTASLVTSLNGQAQEIPKLDGTWNFGNCGDGRGFNLSCMILEEDSPLLTNRAKAYRDAIDEVAQPKYDCAPMPIPHMWTDPYSYQIEQREDRVIIYYGKDDVVRTIWLRGHGHPKPKVNEFFYYGYSEGYYQGGKLIITTNKFTFDPQGLNADFRLPSSTQKEVVEMMSIKDGNLILEVKTIDPFFLNEPWQFRVMSRPDQNSFEDSWQCDLEASRQILKLMPSQYEADPQVNRINYLGD